MALQPRPTDPQKRSSCLVNSGDVPFTKPEQKRGLQGVASSATGNTRSPNSLASSSIGGSQVRDPRAGTSPPSPPSLLSPPPPTSLPSSPRAASRGATLEGPTWETRGAGGAGSKRSRRGRAVAACRRCATTRHPSPRRSDLKQKRRQHLGLPARSTSAQGGREERTH